MSEITLQKTSPLQQLMEFEGKLQQQNPGKDPANFGEILEDALQEVNQAQVHSNDQIKKMLSGDIQDVHSAMIAVQKADLSFQINYVISL